MTLDRCLPQFLLKTNRRGTAHRILIGFSLLNVSILLLTHGDPKALAGVYTLSFLAVMALFGLGNVLLKIKRVRLPRPTHAVWPTVLIGLAAVVAGWIGVAVKDPGYLRVFLQYFVPATLIVSVMLGRIALLKGCLFIVRTITVSLSSTMSGLGGAICKKIDQINAQQIVFFTRGDNIANLNNAMLYVQRNEHTNRIKVAYVVVDSDDVPAKLKQDMKFLDEIYPNVDIEFVMLEGRFSPKLIEDLSQKWDIPKNLMFIGSPSGGQNFDLADLGGRLIT